MRASLAPRFQDCRHEHCHRLKITVASRHGLALPTWANLANELVHGSEVLLVDDGHGEWPEEVQQERYGNETLRTETRIELLGPPHRLNPPAPTGTTSWLLSVCYRASPLSAGASARRKWPASCAGFPVAIKTEMVTRLRSRGDHSGRLHTSPRSTSSASIASPGASCIARRSPFHPLHPRAIEVLGNRDVRRGRLRRRSIPMLLTGRHPRDVSRSNFLDRVTPPLDAARAGRDDEERLSRLCHGQVGDELGPLRLRPGQQRKTEAGSRDRGANQHAMASPMPL